VLVKDEPKYEILGIYLKNDRQNDTRQMRYNS